MTSYSRHSIAVLLALAMFCFSVMSVRAQGVLIDEHNPRFHLPRHHPIIRPQPQLSYKIRELSIDANVRQQVATTQVTQVFQNTGSVQLEASFVFPLPYDGAVERMTFLVDGKEYDAKLLPASEARRLYEGYVRRNQDPALLEWIGTGMFKTSVFPIPAGATRTVTLKYSQLLKRDGNLTDYLFPLSTAKYTSQPIEKIALRVAVNSEQEIKSIYSPTHDINVEREGPNSAVVSLTAANAIPANDFRLMYSSLPGKVAASLISYWPEGQDQGFFLLLASPDFNAKSDDISNKSVVFVVDQSGSMSGDKIVQAREAAKFVMNNLRHGDSFNIIPYESSVQMMSPELLRYDDESRRNGVGYINGIQAGGGTNIHEALQKAVGQISDGSMPSYIVFLTDGLPTVGETNELRISEAVKNANRYRTRIVSFGVGYDVNSRLLDRITRENHGISEYVRPDEDVEASVARLFQKISAPVLTELNLDFQFDAVRVESGPPVNRLYPRELSDLFAGSQLVLVGRYNKSGPARLNLSGKVGETTESFQFDVTFAEQGDNSQYGFLAQLWAMRRIGEIVDLIDMNGKNDELVNELVELATRYGIVTPYTSYLADENALVAGLTDHSGNRERAGEALYSLGDAASGRFGFEAREGKQMMKQVENLAQLGQQSANAYRPGASGGGLGGGGGGADGSVLQTTPAGVRQVGNSTLYKRGTTLVADNALKIDLEKDKDKIVELERFSEAYFKLVTVSSKEENAILSQQQADEELIVSIQGQVYRIK